MLVITNCTEYMTAPANGSHKLVIDGIHILDQKQSRRRNHRQTHA
jgi:hypothetical protein